VHCTHYRKATELESRVVVNPLREAANLLNLNMPISGMEIDRTTSAGGNISNTIEARDSSDKDGCNNPALSLANTTPENREPDESCSSSSHDPNDDIAALAAASATIVVAPTAHTVEACHSSIVATTKTDSQLNFEPGEDPLYTQESLPAESKVAAVEDLPSAEDVVHSLNSIATNEAALIDPTAPPWTAEQHRAFVAAIFEVGLKNCSPSVIMENMRKHPKYITRERTKSHLQKYRQTRVRNKDDFLIQYDAFLAASQKIKEDTIKSSGKEPIPRAVLAAALGGKKTSKLVGGEAAAVLTFSVLNNCSPDHGPDQIPYRAVKTFFPALTDEEKESSLGTSLLFVKGLLHNMTDVLLKARHGISKPLDDGKTEKDSSSSSEEEESSDDEADDDAKPEVVGLAANNLKKKPTIGTVTSNASLDTRERIKAHNRGFGHPVPGVYPEPPHRGPPPPGYGPYPPPHYYGAPPIPNHIQSNHGSFYHQPNHLNHMPYGPPPIMNPHAHIPPHFGAPSYHGPPLASSYPLGPGSYPPYRSYSNDEYYPYAPTSHQASYQEDEHAMDNSNGMNSPSSRATDHVNSDPRFEPFPLDVSKDKRKAPDKNKTGHTTRTSTFPSPLISEQRKRRRHSLPGDEVEHPDSMFSIGAHSTSPIKSKASPIQSRKKRAHTSWLHGDRGSPSTTKSTKVLKRSRSPTFHSVTKQKSPPSQYHSMATPPRGPSSGTGSDNKKLSPDFFFDGAARFSPSEISITTRTSHDGHPQTGLWEPLAIDVNEHSLDQDHSRHQTSTGSQKFSAESFRSSQSKKEHPMHERKEYSGSPHSQHLRGQFFFGE
jgi:SHAQKYF class myb-like DNA-binding protein